MNVASIELCKELYEVSGWKETGFEYRLDDNNKLFYRKERQWAYISSLPAYDLGYLLRKLPVVSEVSHYTEFYYAKYVNLKHITSDDIQTQADTPEDAAAKLAIELFKQGILTKEEQEND